MKKIPLSNTDKFALIDDEDFERISRYKWQFHRENGGAFRAPRSGALQMSRVIMNAPNGFDVDHIDRNRLNNQKHNLRLATRTQNNANSIKRSGCTSKYKGVYWHNQNKNWVARVKKNGIATSLGSFDDEEEAAMAYNNAAQKQFGQFARVNTIQ